MTTRKIERNDIKELATLFNEYRIFYKKAPDLNAAENFLLERFQNNESQIFVAENENKELMGFVQLYPLFSSTRLKRLWLLNDLYVGEKYRGLGVSIALINEAKKLCKETNACGLTLETAKSNTIGNNLYPKTGFSLDSAHNFYSWDND
jgi:GNAT superfamily N-acetyltransferase